MLAGMLILMAGRGKFCRMDAACPPVPDQRNQRPVLSSERAGKGKSNRAAPLP